jgi:hypothetical protein
LEKPKALLPNNPVHSPTSPLSYTSVEPVFTPSAAKSSNISSISSSTTLDSLKKFTPKGSASQLVFFSLLMIFFRSQDQEHSLTSSVVPSTSPLITALLSHPLFHKPHIDNEPTVLWSPIALSPKANISTTSDLAPTSAAPQKIIVPAADDYTPPASPGPETKTTAPAPATTMTENLQSMKNTKASKSKLNAKLMALPPNVKKSTEPR